MPAPPHSLHRLRRSPCSQKPHDLQFDRRRPCSQRPPPPHSLQKVRFCPCTQKMLDPISFIAAFIPFAFNTDANRSCQSLSEAGATALSASAAPPPMLTAATALLACSAPPPVCVDAAIFAPLASPAPPPIGARSIPRAPEHVSLFPSLLGDVLLRGSQRGNMRE